MRPMDRHDEMLVRHLYRRCHPGWDDRPRHWYFAHPTLVIPTATDMIAFASLSLAMIANDLVLLGADLCVHPDHQRRGLARMLFAERLKIGRDVGATTFLGYTQPENAPMVRLFESFGMKPVSTDPMQGVAYAGEIG